MDQAALNQPQTMPCSCRLHAVRGHSSLASWCGSRMLAPAPADPRKAIRCKPCLTGGVNTSFRLPRNASLTTPPHLQGQLCRVDAEETARASPQAVSRAIAPAPCIACRPMQAHGTGLRTCAQFATGLCSPSRVTSFRWTLSTLQVNQPQTFGIYMVALFA